MKTTLIEQRQQAAQTLKQRVCELLQWDEEQYATFQYEMGLAYLQEYIPGDPHGAEQLTRSKVFWNWWKNAWAQRDESFVSSVKHTWKTEDCAYIYLDDNNPALLINNTRPNAVVMDETYKQMIQEFIDEINEPA